MGTRRGHRIYKCDPFGQFLETLEGGIGIIEMLFSTSLIALVGAGDQVGDAASRARVSPYALAFLPSSGFSLLRGLHSWRCVYTFLRDSLVVLHLSEH